MFYYNITFSKSQRNIVEKPGLKPLILIILMLSPVAIIVVTTGHEVGLFDIHVEEKSHKPGLRAQVVGNIVWAVAMNSDHIAF